ncbi:MAG: hypothetical protein K2N87_02525 [Eubacterium sp.]|nr:hypothetical protein [Eubacterium sp.]
MPKDKKRSSAFADAGNDGAGVKDVAGQADKNSNSVNLVSHASSLGSVEQYNEFMDRR